MSRAYKITVKVPVDSGSSNRRMIIIELHANSLQEALQIAQDLKSKKVLGTHWGTFVLSLEPIMEPPVRFKENAENFGFKKSDAIVFKIGEIRSLKNLLVYN